MKKIIVNGGKALCGEVRVSGSKNAALPLIFASLLIDGETTLHKVPDIGDVRVALELLSGFGAEISFVKSTLRINARGVKYRSAPTALTGKIRASTYLLGATLGRFGRAEIPASGGCNFSSRPIDFHINAAKSFGAALVENTLAKDEFCISAARKNTLAKDELCSASARENTLARDELCISAAGENTLENHQANIPYGAEKYLIAEKLRGAKIALPKPSVGATINALLMAVKAHGDSEISGFAREPHVLSVIDFLRAAGAEIRLENGKILVHPAPLHPTEFTVIGDMIEAGTYLTAAMITGGNITVSGIDPGELSAYLDITKELGFIPEILPDEVFFDSGNRSPFAPQKSLSGIRIDSKKRKFSGNKISVSAAPYPAYPTDLQPILAPLIAKESGGEIRDFVFPERFGYLESLAAFGISSTVAEKCVKIKKSHLKPGKSNAPDLRGGMACLLAALCAKGYSEISSADLILRGYDCLVEKLTSLGAEVKTVKM